MAKYGSTRTDVRLGAAAIALSALVAGALTATASAAPAAQQSPRTGLVVATAGGTLPYAAPPVGPLRWRPPQPAAPWTGIRAATAFAPHCPQPPSGFGVASTSENCLYLNVFTPVGASTGGRGLPVMVWIHGGAFIAGESNDYNPAGLVRRGVIVVTINYRLGALGFLAHPALASHPGGSSGDYGLMDQQAALRWSRPISASSAATRATSPCPVNPPADSAFCRSSSPRAPAACSPVPSWKAAPTT